MRILCNWMVYFVLYLSFTILIPAQKITRQAHVLKLVCLLARTTATNKVESLYSPQVAQLMNTTSCSHNLRGTYEIYNLNGENFLSLLNYAFSFLILGQVQSDYESPSSLVEIILTELVVSVFRAHPVHAGVDSKMHSAYNFRVSNDNIPILGVRPSTDGDASVVGLEYSDDYYYHHHHDDDDDDYYDTGDDDYCTRISLPSAQYENITIEDKDKIVEDGNTYFPFLYTYIVISLIFECNRLLLLLWRCCC